ncbi:hypothetical protein BDZ45DRAFT_308153 [Acephala macrosclerotiorum]|nr:hypothetical protein BDZ45DRAFT_308153 [Acephala macrosclerotiorum]
MTPYSAFTFVTGETFRLARHLYCSSSRDIILERGLRSSWQTIPLFGTEYLRELIINKDGEGDFKLPGDTTVVRYITSIGSICAIQLFGIDWESGWIGKVPSAGCGWYGMMKGRAFRYDYNDLNCAVISPSGSSSTTQVVWDWPDFPSTLLDPESALFDFRRDILHSITEVPRRRFFRYLSLYCGVEYTNGLTVYVSTHGIVGLEAYFTRTSRLSGSRHGCTLYFPLCAQERIVYT